MSIYKKWDYLKAGDVVDIIATTPGIGIKNLKEDLLFLSHLIEYIGLIPRINFDAIFLGADYFSNTALEIRKEELYKAIFHSNSKAIWVIRGGYGTSKLLNSLEKTRAPKISKLIIGYSDINCLHLWLNKFWNWPSLHARVLYEFLNNENKPDFDEVVKIITGKERKIVFHNLIPINQLAEQKQVIKAVITGGTIQVLQSGIGLDWQFNAKNKILFFEEIFDRGVRIDRTLNHFYQLGLFDQAKAIIFGDILCGVEADGSENCDLAIKRFAQNLDVPVLSLPGIGHGKRNHPLPLNTESKIIIDIDDIKLICTTGGIIRAEI